ncbi:precorrin-6y C5,15-methyltransferase (decarboxylating) subunit CbiE [Corynebacterium sp. ES2794-CONJ1]|uniref:precorrin-6y C5,15-methyltransferase (decarboxylating) subunit CbiE n=1 Tax=unclassified Corynebacterium TaxID=2624378 RepID=UPI002167DAFA|nr:MULTISPECIES: precorrin-6y C5,15-methyltransferase (decarboxylating) subunit CbiE [unclassified Corynebacterium]MCS4489350.1 precorrin-6y C5,15-methyltransferase (decarboxylating) subunit CbiE [Corynebacterium sp. ES2775-CONJ]MCS4491163.1 precorrin-6y C5,15-methyltransferase (decarboxylating) subunit CbiE [Corynebacterium sp. ES2715-CONJ3]MCS4530956.1 precorrin-6y C5,15-methyltransferase (decarboxylating) subunit CbiE [Corynebacterium sp. ES2730-CONJ]MCU9518323.1 precorrin-6y C5,15-methyltra
MTQSQSGLYQKLDSSARGGAHISVVGMSARGIVDLNEEALAALASSDLVLGSWRQLNLLGEEISAERRPWPSPLVPALKDIFDTIGERKVAVLASGDPMFHGIGTTLKRIFPDMPLTIYPYMSSASLACARLGWALDTTPVHSVVSQPIESLTIPIEEGRPFLVLGRDETTPRLLCALLRDLDQPDAQVEILNDLGGADESHAVGTASNPPAVVSALNIIAVTPSRCGLPLTPGLPDDTYISDGQLSKAHIRALSVAALAPRAGDIIWDIGGGSGSVVIECLRSTSTARGVCFEDRSDRRERIDFNARKLGVSHRLTIAGTAPESVISEKTRPHRVFIGGGLTHPGVFDSAWEKLLPGGRLVANAVTIESEALVVNLRRQYGGSLTRVNISTEQHIGEFTAFKPSYPIVQWVIDKAHRSFSSTDKLESD